VKSFELHVLQLYTTFISVCVPTYKLFARSYHSHSFFFLFDSNWHLSGGSEPTIDGVHARIRRKKTQQVSSSKWWVVYYSL